MAEQPKPPFPEQHIERPGDESMLEPRPRYTGKDYVGASKLLDEVALITGGDSGIGRAVAVFFAREGADVALVYLPEEQSDADETVRAIEAEGREAIEVPGDVTDPDFCAQAVDRVIAWKGRLDILVNNAAYQQHRDDFEGISLEQWDHTFKTNIYGYFNMVRAALPVMKAGATIINSGSVAGLAGHPRLIDYSSTKGAIHTFTKSLALNLVERRIRVNCVAPGPVWTPLNPADQPAEEVAHFGQSTPMQRPAQPEEVAPAFVFFASEADSNFITGEVLTVTGGRMRTG